PTFCCTAILKLCDRGAPMTRPARGVAVPTVRRVSEMVPAVQRVPSTTRRNVMTTSHFRTPLVLAALALATLFASTPAAAGEKQQGNMVSPGGAGWNRDLCNTGATVAPPSASFVAGTSKAA